MDNALLSAGAALVGGGRCVGRDQRRTGPLPGTGDAGRRPRAALPKHLQLVGSRAVATPKRFLRDELIGAITVFCLALAASVPAVLPLALVDHPWIALRMSNLLVVGLLFIVGYHWARYVDANPWLAGFALVALGLALVAVAILLGG